MTAHYVYRCFDADGRLLYVGASKDVPARMQQHQARAFWANDVAKVKVTTHPSPEIALALERVAIREEHPRFNLQGRWAVRHLWTQDHFTDFLIVLADGNPLRPTTHWRIGQIEQTLAYYVKRFGVDHPLAQQLTLKMAEWREQRRVEDEARNVERRIREDEFRKREEADRADHIRHCCACNYGIVVDDEVIAAFADDAGKRVWADESA